MARHRFGDGRYRYFDHPLPDPIGALRESFYRHLAPVANDWSQRLRGPADAFPLEHAQLLERCRAAGQERPTPLILRYGPGDWNALHQDLYGDVYFPFQILTVLSEPRVDYEGGEFVLLEQRPRAQSRAHVLTPPRGAFVIFPTQQRPELGKRGYYKVGMRHGVSTVTQRPADRARRDLPRRPLRLRAGCSASRSPAAPCALVLIQRRKRLTAPRGLPARDDAERSPRQVGAVADRRRARSARPGRRRRGRRRSRSGRRSPRGRRRGDEVADLRGRGEAARRVGDPRARVEEDRRPVRRGGAGEDRARGDDRVGARRSRGPATSSSPAR